MNIATGKWVNIEKSEQIPIPSGELLRNIH